jgi:hypothetical protein
MPPGRRCGFIRTRNIRLAGDPAVKHLILLAENNDASRKATEACGNRWADAGRRVTRIWPREDCDDLNDELMLEVSDGAA